MTNRARFARPPPTSRAERAAQIAEQLQSRVVRIAGSMRARSKGQDGMPAKEKARRFVR